MTKRSKKYSCCHICFSLFNIEVHTSNRLAELLKGNNSRYESEGDSICYYANTVL